MGLIESKFTVEQISPCVPEPLYITTSDYIYSHVMPAGTSYNLFQSYEGNVYSGELLHTFNDRDNILEVVDIDFDPYYSVYIGVNGVDGRLYIPSTYSISLFETDVQSLVQGIDFKTTVLYFNTKPSWLVYYKRGKGAFATQLEFNTDKPLESIMVDMNLDGTEIIGMYRTYENGIGYTYAAISTTRDGDLMLYNLQFDSATFVVGSEIGKVNILKKRKLKINTKGIHFTFAYPYGNYLMLVGNENDGEMIIIKYNIGTEIEQKETVQEINSIASVYTCGM